ncbi:MAG: outer membrane beta-barrel protein [Bacteroidetes bacterium]|nr:outer membrane beta-barrel protein [Bacteroidota bacterium]
MQRVTAVLVVLAVFAGANRSDAQILSRGDLFGPGAPPAMIGVELGLGMHQQQGTYQAACSCEFTDGSMSGFLGGLLFELPLDYEWTLGIAAKFDFKGLDNSTITQDTATMRFLANDSVAKGIIHMHRTGTVRETFLTFNPFVRYEFYRNGPFVQIGPGIGIVLSSSFKHTRELLSSSVQLLDSNLVPTGQVIPGVTFENGTNSETLQDEKKVANINTLQITLNASLGYDIPVGDNAVIAPMVTYSLPFTAVRPDIQSTGWKVSSLYVSAGFKYKLD